MKTSPSADALRRARALLPIDACGPDAGALEHRIAFALDEAEQRGYQRGIAECPRAHESPLDGRCLDDAPLKAANTRIAELEERLECAGEALSGEDV